jgi:hypothetical protein
MSQPITDRPALDTFLPQFAPASDQQNSQPPDSNGERRELNGLPQSSFLNGRLSELETVQLHEHSDEPSKVVIDEHQNGSLGNSLHEPADALPSTVAPSTAHRGNGAAHTNGSPAIESSLKGAMAEILATASQSDSVASVPSNGTAAVEIGDQSTAPPGDIEAPTATDQEAASDEIDEPQGAVEDRPASPSEHPAAGSLFTPYLVTEIRELRNRCRRRSWWRRLFG